MLAPALLKVLWRQMQQQKIYFKLFVPSNVAVALYMYTRSFRSHLSWKNPRLEREMHSFCNPMLPDAGSLFFWEIKSCFCKFLGCLVVLFRLSAFSLQNTHACRSKTRNTVSVFNHQDCCSVPFIVLPLQVKIFCASVWFNLVSSRSCLVSSLVTSSQTHAFCCSHSFTPFLPRVTVAPIF